VSQKTILIVDDDEDFRMTYRDALELFGYRTLCAASGAEALELLRRQPVELILLDLMMPHMDGQQLHAILVADPALRNIPVVAVTAGDTRLDGATHLSKVAELGEVLEVVRRSCA
jgi:CheY-like chemotaxis protein